MDYFRGILACACVLIALPAGAETIKLRSGQSVQGKILKEEKNSILVDAGIDIPITYFRDEIQAILPDGPVQTTPVKDDRGRADALEAQAVELIDNEQMDEGIELIRQALELNPSPGRYLNYGSILFGNGVELFKKGQEEQGKAILRQSEEQLNKAISGFDKTKDIIFISQAYFLLGEMYAHAFADLPQAKALYQKSLSAFDHDGAKTALEKLK